MDAATSHVVRNEFDVARQGRDATREPRARAVKVRPESAALRRQGGALTLRPVIPEWAPSDGDANGSADTAGTHDVSRLTAELAEANAMVEHLRAALASRDLIWEAKLIIAAAVGCDAHEAHQLLIKQSQHENRKVREIAAAIVQRQRA